MPKVRTLYIQVGGLCMLVQRMDLERLVVLMPSHTRPNHLHCPYLHAAPGFTGGREVLKRVEGVLDLGGLSTSGGRQDLDGVVLDASHATGGSPVRGEYMENPPAGALVTRIVLPLAAAEFQPLGEQAELHLHAGSDHEVVYSYGRVGIRIDLDDALDALEIPRLGVRLLPDDNDSVELAFLNVRPKDLGAPLERMAPNEHLHHVHGYFDLLDLKAPAPMVHSPPRLRTGVDKRLGDTVCDRGRYATLPRWGASHPAGEHIGAQRDETGREDPHILSIDPYTCTVGGGCYPPGDC